MNGKGTLKKGLDSYYEGEFELNKKQGRGKLKIPFGVYEGSFVDGLMNKEGVFRWNDGRIYNGNF